MAKQVALYKIPESFDVARILDESVLPAYTDSIQRYGEVARKTLGKFNSHDGELTGSNSPMLVELANSGLLPVGSRLAERADSEKAISYEPSFGQGNYFDVGLALV